MARASFIEQLEHLVGKRVKCVQMDNDPNPVPNGTEGTVQFIDDAGHIHVKWDNGQSLSLLPCDEYIVIERKCTQPLYRDCHLFYHNGCKGCPVFI